MELRGGGVLSRSKPVFQPPPKHHTLAIAKAVPAAAAAAAAAVVAVAGGTNSCSSTACESSITSMDSDLPPQPSSLQQPGDGEGWTVSAEVSSSSSNNKDHNQNQSSSNKSKHRKDHLSDRLSRTRRSKLFAAATATGSTTTAVAVADVDAALIENKTSPMPIDSQTVNHKESSSSSSSVDHFQVDKVADEPKLEKTPIELKTSKAAIAASRSRKITAASQAKKTAAIDSNSPNTHNEIAVTESNAVDKAMTTTTAASPWAFNNNLSALSSIPMEKQKRRVLAQSLRSPGLLDQTPKLVVNLSSGSSPTPKKPNDDHIPVESIENSATTSSLSTTTEDASKTSSTAMSGKSASQMEKRQKALAFSRAKRGTAVPPKKVDDVPDVNIDNNVKVDTTSTIPTISTTITDPEVPRPKLCLGASPRSKEEKSKAVRTITSVEQHSIPLSEDPISFVPPPEIPNLSLEPAFVASKINGSTASRAMLRSKSVDRQKVQPQGPPPLRRSGTETGSLSANNNNYHTPTPSHSAAASVSSTTTTTAATTASSEVNRRSALTTKQSQSVIVAPPPVPAATTTNRRTVASLGSSASFSSDKSSSLSTTESSKEAESITQINNSDVGYLTQWKKKKASSVTSRSDHDGTTAVGKEATQTIGETTTSIPVSIVTSTPVALKRQTQLAQGSSAGSTVTNRPMSDDSLSQDTTNDVKMTTKSTAVVLEPAKDTTNEAYQMEVRSLPPMASVTTPPRCTTPWKQVNKLPPSQTQTSPIPQLRSYSPIPKKAMSFDSLIMKKQPPTETAQLVAADHNGRSEVLPSSTPPRKSPWKPVKSCTTAPIMNPTSTSSRPDILPSEFLIPEQDIAPVVPEVASVTSEPESPVRVNPWKEMRQVRPLSRTSSLGTLSGAGVTRAASPYRSVVANKTTNVFPGSETLQPSTQSVVRTATAASSVATGSSSPPVLSVIAAELGEDTTESSLLKLPLPSPKECFAQEKGIASELNTGDSSTTDNESPVRANPWKKMKQVRPLSRASSIGTPSEPTHVASPYHSMVANQSASSIAKTEPVASVNTVMPSLKNKASVGLNQTQFDTSHTNTETSFKPRLSSTPSRVAQRWGQPRQIEQPAIKDTKSVVSSVRDFRSPSSRLVEALGHNDVREEKKEDDLVDSVLTGPAMKMTKETNSKIPPGHSPVKKIAAPIRASSSFTPGSNSDNRKVSPVPFNRPASSLSLPPVRRSFSSTLSNGNQSPVPCVIALTGPSSSAEECYNEAESSENQSALNQSTIETTGKVKVSLMTAKFGTSTTSVDSRNSAYSPRSARRNSPLPQLSDTMNRDGKPLLKRSASVGRLSFLTKTSTQKLSTTPDSRPKLLVSSPPNPSNISTVETYHKKNVSDMKAKFSQTSVKHASCSIPVNSNTAKNYLLKPLAAPPSPTSKMVVLPKPADGNFLHKPLAAPPSPTSKMVVLPKPADSSAPTSKIVILPEPADSADPALEELRSLIETPEPVNMQNMKAMFSGKADKRNSKSSSDVKECRTPPRPIFSPPSMLNNNRKVHRERIVDVSTPVPPPLPSRPAVIEDSTCSQHALPMNDSFVQGQSHVLSKMSQQSASVGPEAPVDPLSTISHCEQVQVQEEENRAETLVDENIASDSSSTEDKCPTSSPRPATDRPWIKDLESPKRWRERVQSPHISRSDSRSDGKITPPSELECVNQTPTRVSSLAQLAVDSVHAVDFDQAMTIFELNNSSSSVSVRHCHTSDGEEAIPNDLPIEFAESLALHGDARLTNNQESTSKIQRSPLAVTIRVSDDPTRESQGDSGIVFGDPTTYGEAGGEEAQVLPPPVKDRARAIANWKGGLGIVPNKSNNINHSDHDSADPNRNLVDISNSVCVSENENENKKIINSLSPTVSNEIEHVTGEDENSSPDDQISRLLEISFHNEMPLTLEDRITKSRQETPSRPSSTLLAESLRGSLEERDNSQDWYDLNSNTRTQATLTSRTASSTPQNIPVTSSRKTRVKDIDISRLSNWSRSDSPSRAVPIFRDTSPFDPFVVERFSGTNEELSRHVVSSEIMNAFDPFSESGEATDSQLLDSFNESFRVPPPPAIHHSSFSSAPVPAIVSATIFDTMVSDDPFLDDNNESFSIHKFMNRKPLREERRSSWNYGRKKDSGRKSSRRSSPFPRIPAD